ARDPYFLYAASNLGSIGALAAYPLAIEPHVGLAGQARAMRVAFAVLVVMVAGCGFAMRGKAEPETEAEAETGTGTGTGTASESEAARRVRWVLLGAVPSGMLLAVTTYVTTEIAPAPLLWAIPLGAYLLSFVVVFAPRRLVPHAWVARAMPFALALVVYMLAVGANHPPILVLPIHLVAFFIAATFCHGELAADRPGSRRLPEFYLWMATGGALGGAAVALGAPALLAQPIEYPVTILFALACRPSVSKAQRREWLRVVLVAAVALGVALACRRFGLSRTVTTLAAGVPLLIAFTLEGEPRPFVFAMGAVLACGALSQNRGTVDLAHERSFFGALTVTRDAAAGTTTLLHGNTIHGVQIAAEPRSPTTYYSERGPAGDVFRATEGAPRHVALVGLGTGTLATYARPGDRWRFFEIDPAVVKVARDTRYFTYLADAFPAAADVVVGDARLELAKDEGGYDLLVIDAFSSDAIPVHLLTREAFALYRRKLAPGAIVLWHISNRYLELETVVAELAHDQSWTAVLRDDHDVPDEEANKRVRIGSTWVAMSADAARLEPLRKTGEWREVVRRAGFSEWTDDRAAILEVLR
ncbi:MAG TPA: fused MFS/spermidine synthase, partial [Polyangiaceae bacterium]|nr:fused MFS/spermidine synthase [Polyangiaceae bacterium]